VLCFPDRAIAFDPPIESAMPPLVSRAYEYLSGICNLFAGQTREPLPVEGLRPAAKHDRKAAGQIFPVGFPALFAPQARDPISIARQDDICIAAAHEGTAFRPFRNAQDKAVKLRPAGIGPANDR
jgi:hypothetical protein